MTQVTRHVLYGSSWTPYNGSNPSNARPWSYWTDLGFTDMLFHVDCPGTNQSPAAYRPMGNEAAFVASSAKAAGMNLILATKMHGYVAPTSGTADAQKMPFSPAPDGLQHDWLFDDAHWNNNVLPGVHTLARWAKENGFIGVHFDEEIASGVGGWSYANYNLYWPGHTQAQCEAQATVRGKQWMTAILAEFPGAEYHNYSASGWPGAWDSFWRSKYTITPTAPGSPTLQNFFYKGVAAIPGYKHLYIWNADFYYGQYHATSGNTYTYGGKVYDAWEWGSTQFDRDGFHRFCFGPNNVAGGGFMEATTDPAKVDIVPFFSQAPIQGGKSATFSEVAEQQAPSVNQKPAGHNDQPLPNGQPWHGDAAHPIILCASYAYSNQADATNGTDAAGNPIPGGNFDFTQFRTPLRAMVQLSTSTLRTVPITISDGVSSATTNLNVSS